MAQIVDHRGRPLEQRKLDEPQTARVASLHREFAGHPTRGLTPPRLARILQAAEQGDLVQQAELGEDMEEKDAHLFAELSKRKRALLGLDWDIVAPKDATPQEERIAEEVKAVVRAIDNLDDVFLDMLDAIGKGYSCTEIEWQRDGRQRVPRLTHRPPGWFMTHQKNQNELRLRDSSGEGQELWPFGWIVHTHKAKSGYIARGGLHRILAWPFLFKNYSVRDLAEFLEIYGLPMRLGTYPTGSDDTEKAKLMQAVVAIGHAAAGIVPEGMMIDFKEAAKGTEGPFNSMIEWAERSMSKAILGGTLTTQADGKSSTNALGNVHNEVRHDLLVSDAVQVANTFTRDICYAIAVINFAGLDPRRTPRLVFDTREAEDLKLLSEAIPPLVDAGAEIPVRWINDKTRIPVPEDGEPILRRVSIAPDQPVIARAALRARPDTHDEFDLLSDELAGEWERVSAPMIEPLLALASSAGSYEEFRRQLPALLRSQNLDALVESLAQGQFAARIYGRVNDDRERR